MVERRVLTLLSVRLGRGILSDPFDTVSAGDEVEGGGMLWRKKAMVEALALIGTLGRFERAERARRYSGD